MPLTAAFYPFLTLHKRQNRPQAVSHKTFFISDQSPQPDHHPFVCRADLLRNHPRPTRISPYRTGRTLPWATMLSSEKNRCSVYRYPLSVCGSSGFRCQHLRHTTEHHTGTERKQDAGHTTGPNGCPHGIHCGPAIKNDPNGGSPQTIWNTPPLAPARLGTIWITAPSGRVH